MENTKQTPPIEKRTRFFAQYWGQKVLCFNDNGHTKYTINAPNMFGKGITNQMEKAFLQLKPLSKITEKDLEKIGFGNISNKKVTFDFLNYNYWWSSSCGMHGTLLLKDIDFLRSKGYAVPFMEYSVEDLVNFGWVKLLNE